MNPINQAIADNAVYDGITSNPLFVVFVVGVILFVGILVFMKKNIKGPEHTEDDK